VTAGATALPDGSLLEGGTGLEPFENLDRAATIEMRTIGFPAGIVRHLYAAARGELPITYEIARALHACAGARVAIFTGIVADPLPVGEVDGPIGAAVLAQTLAVVGVGSHVVVPEEMAGVMDAVQQALRADLDIRHVAAPGSEYAAVVAIEKLGRNAMGTTHTVLGTPVVQGFEADDLVEEFNRDGRPTIGIGDGGNEVGFGAIRETALERVPRGRDCGCPCGGGIVTATATQLLFPASVSNFGAYAVANALAALAGRPALAPYPDAVASAIEAAVRAGCLDGGTFTPHVLADDGVPLDGVKNVVGVMRTIVLQSFRTSPRFQ
jgi:hypothetical protein